MAPILKKMSCIVSPYCFNAKKTHSPVSKVNISNQISPQIQRLSLSDVSNPRFPISPQDLSNSLVGSNLHMFSLKELALMTNNFSRNEFLGKGGFGKVYRGYIDDSLKPGLEAQSVAVKVLDLKGSQGHKEWLAEIIFLGQLKHPHLVTLIGYCYEYEHRLLVYEYMPLGNLENKLFENGSATLPWLIRIKIAIGTAKCLAFLHGGVKKPVIYRDLKSSNILLDKDYIAKLSDFGLAKDGPEGDDTHISTCIMGTHGYAAPEYIMTGQLTTMCDVYSFGVVLLELLTGRPSIDKHRPRREQYLVEWAWPFLKNLNKIEQIMDPRLSGQYSNKGIKKAAELAYKCLSRDPKSRPTMSTVVKVLEPVLDFSDISRGHFVCTVSSQPNIDYVFEKVKKTKGKRKIIVATGMQNVQENDVGLGQSGLASSSYNF